MKVAFVTYNFPPRIGGMPTLHRQYAHALHHAGHQVEVFAWRDNSNPDQGDYEYPVTCTKASQNPILNFIRTGFTLLGLLPRLKKADFILAGFGEEMGLKIWLHFYNLFLGKPIVLTAGGRILLNRHGGLLAWLRQRLVIGMLRRARCIITDGEDIKRELEAASIRSDIINVLYSGIDEDKWQADSNLALQELVLPKRPCLAFVGRMAEENGPLEFLDIARQLPDCGVMMLGGGPLLESVQQRSNDFKQRLLLPGFVTGGMLPALLSHADVCLFPLSDFHGGIPLVVLEAMALGKAVVAYKVGDLEKLIDSGVNGILVDSANHQRLLSATKELLQDATLREKMGKQAAITVQQNWDYPSTRDRFLNIIESLSK
jgi:glycosyltransferase involved in cell wall biosynthesis